MIAVTTSPLEFKTCLTIYANFGFSSAGSMCPRQSRVIVAQESQQPLRDIYRWPQALARYTIGYANASLQSLHKVKTAAAINPVYLCMHSLYDISCFRSMSIHVAIRPQMDRLIIDLSIHDLLVQEEA